MILSTIPTRFSPLCVKFPSDSRFWTITIPGNDFIIWYLWHLVAMSPMWNRCWNIRVQSFRSNGKIVVGIGNGWNHSIGRPTTAAVTYLEDPFLDRIRGPWGVGRKLSNVIYAWPLSIFKVHWRHAVIDGRSQTSPSTERPNRPMPSKYSFFNIALLVVHQPFSRLRPKEM
jgi:hypothetical protein